MSVADLFLETLSAFNANRARSLLTILGIVIGIAAVISSEMEEALSPSLRLKISVSIGQTIEPRFVTTRPKKRT